MLLIKKENAIQKLQKLVFNFYPLSLIYKKLKFPLLINYNSLDCNFQLLTIIMSKTCRTSELVHKYKEQSNTEELINDPFKAVYPLNELQRQIFQQTNVKRSCHSCRLSITRIFQNWDGQLYSNNQIKNIKAFQNILVQQLKKMNQDFESILAACSKKYIPCQMHVLLQDSVKKVSELKNYPGDQQKLNFISQTNLDIINKLKKVRLCNKCKQELAITLGTFSPPGVKRLLMKQEQSEKLKGKKLLEKGYKQFLDFLNKNKSKCNQQERQENWRKENDDLGQEDISDMMSSQYGTERKDKGKMKLSQSQYIQQNQKQQQNSSNTLKPQRKIEYNQKQEDSSSSLQQREQLNQDKTPKISKSKIKNGKNSGGICKRICCCFYSSQDQQVFSQCNQALKYLHQNFRKITLNVASQNYVKGQDVDAQRLDYQKQKNFNSHLKMKPPFKF